MQVPRNSFRNFQYSTESFRRRAGDNGEGSEVQLDRSAVMNLIGSFEAHEGAP
jgi:hypothetical protein